MPGYSMKTHLGTRGTQQILKIRFSMEINLKPTKKTERVLRLKDAKKYIKKTTHLDITLPRLRGWITRGLVSHSGRRSVLRARRKYGVWFTTDRAVDEFIQELDR